MRIYIISIILFFLSTITKSQTAIDIKARQSNGQILINYKLPASTPSYLFDIHVFCKIGDSDSFELKSVSGDVGHEIKGGKTEYQVNWDVFEDLDEFSTADFFVNVTLLNPEKFVLTDADSNKLKEKLLQDKIINQAKQDAKIYYKNSGPLWGTGCASLAFMPAGLIVALISSVTEPDEKNLKIPQNEYKNNKLYENTYKTEALKLKRKRVWITFGVIAVPELILLIYSYTQ